jgi:hypothetical protein
MAVTWTTINAGQVAVDAAVDTALMTALRDNPEGIAQRASGAPKIFGVAYDYQEFLNGGSTTWTKPSNAETGDKVVIQVVGGGQSGQRDSASIVGGGDGGAGIIKTFEDIDDFGETEAVAVGGGGPGVTGTSPNNGGASSFGTQASGPYVYASGGGMTDSVIAMDTNANNNPTNDADNPAGTIGGAYATPNTGSSVYGAGGGGRGQNTSSESGGGYSLYAGSGGDGTDDTGAVGDYDIDGKFPGGGGGGVHTGTTGDTISGAGADGVVRVWCIKEE